MNGPALRARSRAGYALAASVVLLGGLLWRSRLLPLPGFAAKYGGDALWALLVYLGLGFCLTRISTWRLGLLALTFAWLVEFSQLYHAPWIDHLRDTRLGRLILGATFNPPDLFAYAVGIALGVLVEGRLRRRQINEPAP